MIPAAFTYERADSPEVAVGLLTEHGEDAKLLAGGHSLLPLMRLRLAAPSMLIDIGRCAGAAYVREEGDDIAIGALTRHRDLEIDPLLGTHAPLLAFVAGQVGDPQVRHRGTIGGSLAHGDPASDLPAALLALDATLVAFGPSGRREIRAAQFHEGFLETALRPTEMLLEIRVPKQGSARWAFQKFNRRAQDWAIVGVAAVVNHTPRVALVNMAPVPMRATAVEDALAQGATARDAADLAAEGTAASSDPNASAEYREHLARVLVRRALEEAGV